MTLQEVIIQSFRIISCTIIAVVLIRALSNLANKFSLFRQNLKLESQKQANAKELICLRNAEQPKEDLLQKVAELSKLVKELNEKIKPADDTTKQELEKAKAKLEVYQETIQLIKNKLCTN